MAGRRSSSSEAEKEQRSVFVTTSLDTRLAVAVHHSDTVWDLKRNVIITHLSTFPRFGEIKVDAIKVKRRGCFYHLHDPVLLRTIFGQKNYWYLYVDASASAVYLKEVILQNGPFSCDAPVLQSEDLNVEKDNEGRESAVADDLIDASSADSALGGRKKLKVQESSKHHEQEDLALNQRAKGSDGQIQEQTAYLMALMIKQTDNKRSVIEKKVEKVFPVQEQVLIKAENSVQNGLQSGVDLALISNNGCLEEDEADGRAEEDDLSRVSSATSMDESKSSSKKRKKLSRKKELGKNKIVDSKVENGLQQVDGSKAAISEAKAKEPAVMETRAKQTTDNMELVDKEVAPADVGDGSRVQKGLNLLLGENLELSDRDVADRRAEKGEVVTDSLAAVLLETVSSRDKRKMSAYKKDSRRKKAVVHSEEHVLKHVEGSPGSNSLAKPKELDNKEMLVLSEEHVLKHVEGLPGSISLAKPKELDNKEMLVKEVTESVAVVHKNGAVPDTSRRGGVLHGPELVLEEINGQINENGAIISAMSVDGMGENASEKKRKKSTVRKGQNKKKIINANEENLRKYVDGLEGVSSMGPGETHNKETCIENSTNVIQANELALNTDAGDVSGVQIFPEQVENNGEFIDNEAITGAEGVVSHDPFIANVMEYKSSTKNRKKSTRTKESSKKKALDPDEKHVLKQYLIDTLGPRQMDGPKGVSSLPEPKEPDNIRKSIEKLDDKVIVHHQALGADADYGSEVQNGPALLLQGENDRQFLGEGATIGTEKGHDVNDLIASGVVVDESSKKKTKKFANKPSKKKTVYPEEKLVLMHVEDSIGANSLAETKEANNKEKNIRENAGLVVVHEQPFDDNAGDGVQEETTEVLHGDEAYGEAEKANLAPGLLASGVKDEDESSKKKTKKSTNKLSKKRTVRPEEKLTLKQDPEEKVVPEYVEDSTAAISQQETKEADNKEKNMREKSPKVVVVREQTFGADSGDRLWKENNEQCHGHEANSEAEKVNLAPKLLDFGVMEDESSKKKTKKSTNKSGKKKTVHPEEKLALKQNPIEKVVPKHAERSVGADSLAESREADIKEKSQKEKFADIVVVYEQTFDADSGDRVQEKNNEQLHGDEAAGEVEKLNLGPDSVVSGKVKDMSSPKKKKPTLKKNATMKKPIDLLEYERENIESSLGGSSLARSRELVNSKNNFFQVEGNESFTLVSYEKTAGLRTEVTSQETLERKGMTGDAQETRRTGKRKQSASNRSLEKEGNISASSQMTKKESQKFVSISAVSKSDNLLSSDATICASDRICEESGSIKFCDYFAPSGPQVAVAASADTREVAGMKGNGKISPPNLRNSRDSEASASAIEVTKNNKNKHSNLDRYCVAFRNSSNQSLQASVEEHKRSLLDKSSSIFKDESSGYSDDDGEGVKSDATTRTPCDDTVSSDYSDGDSNALVKSQEKGNDSHQNGRQSNMKNLLSSSGRNVELTKILQSSSRYKMVKRAATQSQMQDMDSRPIDFVPDGEADV